MVVEYVVAEDAVRIMTLALEEERIESYDMSHCPYFGYLNGDHKTTLK